VDLEGNREPMIIEVVVSDFLLLERTFASHIMVLENGRGKTCSFLFPSFRKVRTGRFVN
jgi:hypothetical protein